MAGDQLETVQDKNLLKEIKCIPSETTFTTKGEVDNIMRVMYDSLRIFELGYDAKWIHVSRQPIKDFTLINSATYRCHRVTCTKRQLNT